MSTIRNLAVGLPMRDGHVLMIDGEDRVTDEAFHRAIGGGIEFGETAEAALRREFAEELEVSLDAVSLLGVLENIFEFEGQPGHEIVHVFAVESAELDRIPLDAQLHVVDEGSPVHWVPIARTTVPFYPRGVAEFIGIPAHDVPDPDRQQLVDRRYVLAACVTALDRLPELIDICTRTPGSDALLVQAIAEAFDLDELQADLVLGMQLRRLSPARTAQLRGELADVDAALAALDD